MHCPPSAALAPSRHAGFTLIELLVVIAIIAVLAGLLLPVYNKVQYASMKVKVVNDVRNIKTAIVAYYGDYQKYPLTPGQVHFALPGSGAPNGSGGYDTVYGDPNGYYSSADLMNILLARNDFSHQYNTNNVSNPSQTIYWNGPLAASLTQPRNGISQADVTWKDHMGSAYTIPKGSLMDPWGRSYVIWMDATKDGDLSYIASEFYIDLSAATGTTPTGLPPLGIGVSSMGADGFFGTVTSAKPYGNGILQGSDDIVVWQ